MINSTAGNTSFSSNVLVTVPPGTSSYIVGRNDNSSMRPQSAEPYSLQSPLLSTLQFNSTIRLHKTTAPIPRLPASTKIIYCCGNLHHGFLKSTHGVNPKNEDGLWCCRLEYSDEDGVHHLRVGREHFSFALLLTYTD